MKITESKYGSFKFVSISIMFTLVSEPSEFLTKALPEIKLSRYVRVRVREVQFSIFPRIMCVCRTSLFNMKTYNPKTLIR